MQYAVVLCNVITISFIKNEIRTQGTQNKRYKIMKNKKNNTDRNYDS